MRRRIETKRMEDDGFPLVNEFIVMTVCSSCGFRFKQNGHDLCYDCRAHNIISGDIFGGE